MKKEKRMISISGIFYMIVIILGLFALVYIYRTNYFNGFEKATVSIFKKTKFVRDSKVKYSDYDSYKIQSSEYNDATFYKEVEVTPNTPYKISCMVKTENVTCEDPNKDGGVIIGLLDTIEYSAPITGTNDWQKIEYMFNSNNRDKVKISFRMGGIQNSCTGTSWFSDFKLEKGTPRKDTVWKVGCYIIDEVDVEIEGNEYNLKINETDIENVKLNLERYKNDCYNYSKKRMAVNYEIKEVKEPITTITYSDEHGYFIGHKDVKDAIYQDAKNNEYDHVFIVCRMENESGTVSIPIFNNWIGLGGMDMYGIGYSLVRLNKNSNLTTYRFGISNRAPEEVYVHEFLHTLERNMTDNGYEVPALHDFEKYGYLESAMDGLDQWYKDYMAGNILDRQTGERVGLNDFVYGTQPPNNSNFNYAMEVDFNKEPHNLLEHILTIKYYFVR